MVKVIIKSEWKNGVGQEKGKRKEATLNKKKEKEREEEEQEILKIWLQNRKYTN